MAFLLNPRTWIYFGIALALGIAGAFIYRVGKATVRAEFDSYKLTQAEQARQSEQASRAKEQALQATLTKAQDDATKREKTLRASAAGARSERDRLRDAISAATGDLVPSDTPITILARATTLGGLLNQCSERYQFVAEQADRHASDARTLSEAWPKP